MAIATTGAVTAILLDHIGQDQQCILVLHYVKKFNFMQRFTRRETKSNGVVFFISFGDNSGSFLPDIRQAISRICPIDSSIAATMRASSSAHATERPTLFCADKTGISRIASRKIRRHCCISPAFHHRCFERAAYLESCMFPLQGASILIRGFTMCRFEHGLLIFIAEKW
uniref:hypothetical protein n=1 Tax=Salmonella sp. TaxID=599 RepID=UPI001CD9784E|nr:hypothetical protein [Salmonella sp.]